MYSIKWQTFYGLMEEYYSSRWKWLAIRKFKKVAFSSSTVCRWVLCKGGTVLIDLCKVRCWDNK